MSENKPTEQETKALKELITKIGAIQAEIGDLIKDENNKHQNYKYFNEAELLKILKPKLKEKKLTLEITDDDTQPFQWEREGTKHFIRYLKKMEISDQETGQSKVYKFWACGDNTDLAKAKGASETYAMKYMLSKFFLIRSIDENDPELKEPAEPEKNKSTNDLYEKERQDIREKVIKKADGWWYCKSCEDNKKEPYKLIQDKDKITVSELTEALRKHGELNNKK